MSATPADIPADAGGRIELTKEKMSGVEKSSNSMTVLKKVHCRRIVENAKQGFDPQSRPVGDRLKNFPGGRWHAKRLGADTLGALPDAELPGIGIVIALAQKPERE